jgi:hypothetical protein|tara:strand:+ start:513 stop:701 length:189 start_codon:yes stop_codon:yes gene_type:complete
MTDKVKQIIWVYDKLENKKKRIQLKTLLDRINHYSKHSVYSKQKYYFALEEDRNKFIKQSKL